MKTTSDITKIFNTMEYGDALESQTTADEWLSQHRAQFDLFINGQWHAPRKATYFPSINPANGAELAKIAQANSDDVNAAVHAAKKAQKKWTDLGGHGRARFLYAIARHVQKHARLFAVLESLDNGKPIRESRDIDIPLVARHFYHHAGWAQLMETEFSDYTALGVVGQIIPWNFPLLMLAWKIAPALAMGNTVVLKPAEQTSLTALLFAEICEQIGLPPGVVNIVTGDSATGELIVQHPDIQKIAFTGSTEIGKRIRQATAGSGKKLSLELGGKSPFIVFADADLDSVVEGLVDAIWFNQGQVCCAGSRLLVQESIADTLINKIKKRLSTFRVGDALDKTIDMGAIIDPTQLAKIQALVKSGEQAGATLWQPDNACPEDGCFFPPTLFTNVAPAAEIAQVEIFGPVLISMTFRTQSEAVALANNTRYGLAASIWTENINLALDIAPKIKAGSIWINCTNVFDAAAGFGGYRESGFGREGGKEGLWEYVKPKWEDQLSTHKTTNTFKMKTPPTTQAIDRTAKLYIGGKQVRPDSGHSYTTLSDVSLGNRKDIRNAVAAAEQADAWEKTTAHQRAQILYYLAENLSARHDEFAKRIVDHTGVNDSAAKAEVAQCIERLFTYAAYADKYDGHIHHTPLRNVTLAMPEAIGVLGIVCPAEVSLIGLISTAIPAIAMGNRVVVVPAKNYALIATDFYQVLDTSDVPAGVINIVTGDPTELAEVLAKHDGVDGIWYFGDQAGSKMVEHASADNMKRTWVTHGKLFDWYDNQQAQGQEFLRHATQIKNIWVPYGE